MSEEVGADFGVVCLVITKSSLSYIPPDAPSTEYFATTGACHLPPPLALSPLLRLTPRLCLKFIPLGSGQAIQGFRCRLDSHNIIGSEENHMFLPAAGQLCLCLTLPPSLDFAPLPVLEVYPLDGLKLEASSSSKRAWAGGRIA